MNIIDSNGDYKYQEGTRTIQVSEHPVYQARIELALPLNTWCFAPNVGHQLKKFDREDQSQEKTEAYEKELQLYLDKYGPETLAILSQRGESRFQLEIKEDALDGQNT